MNYSPFLLRVPVQRWARRPLVAAALLASVSAYAQDAAPAAPAKETTVVLPTFTVNSPQDFGYRATNSITATGIGTEIYSTPISISVVTKDLINDIGGAGLLREILQYTAGVTTDSRDPNQYTTRGFLTPVLVNRVGGVSRNPTADFVERVEVVKGPNSVFFGRVAPGGVINLITLRPGLTRETKVKLVGGSYDYARIVVDHNQPLTRDISLRVAGSFLNRDDGYYDWTYQRQNAVYGALTWRLTENVTFNVNADYLDAKQNQPHSGARSDPEYLADPANIGVAISAWGARVRTPNNLPSITMFADDVAYANGDKGNGSGPENYKLDRAKNFQAELSATPQEWLALHLVAARRDAMVQTLEHGGYPDPTGTMVASRANFNGANPRSDIYEAEAVAEFKTGPVGHRLLVGARYVENADKTFALTGRAVNWNTKRQGPRLVTTEFATWPIVPTTFNVPSGTETAYYAAYQASLLADKVKILGGVRHIEVKNTANPGQTPLQTSDTTPQIGVFWEMVKDFSLFANYSQTFEPQFQVDVFGNIAPNVQGSGKEIGLKTRYLEGRLSGTVSMFEVLREGEARRDFLRETALGLTPILIAGGSSRSRGTELEFTYTPARNYQLLFAYTYLWEREVIKDTASPILVGRKLPLSPEHTFALWQRYTFTSGSLKGLTIGGGVRHQSNTSATLQPIFNLKLENSTPVDLLLSYGTNWGRSAVTYQLNVKNLFDEKYHDSSSLLADPLTVYLSAGLKF
jgi:iron complex outermembrane receptor protein